MSEPRHPCGIAGLKCAELVELRHITVTRPEEVTCQHALWVHARDDACGVTARGQRNGKPIAFGIRSGHGDHPRLSQPCRVVALTCCA